MSEKWRDIPGYKGLYQASSSGQIKSLRRKIKRKDGNYLTVKERILKPSINPKGYKLVVLSYKGNSKTMQVHRLVAKTFLGYSKLQVDHINGTKTDNRIKNLQYLTCRENAVKYNKNRIGNTSKYTGVFAWRNKWRSAISINGKSYYIGVFDSELSAHRAYKDVLLNGPLAIKNYRKRTK